MTVDIGIALAFVAMLSWGFGDFLIQRSTRRLGDWETLFIITAFGALVLLPFAWRDALALFSGRMPGAGLLTVASVVLLLAALLEFEAVRRGKLAVVEPIWSLEVIVAAFLALFILGERASSLQTVLIAVLIVSLMLVAFRSRRLTKAHLLEKGVIVAAVSAVAMGAAAFFLGWAGRVTDPVITNFFSDAFLATTSGAYLLANGRMTKVFTDIRHSYPLLLPMSVCDKVAWLAYVFSMSMIPIAVATGLSESYVIIAVLLGLSVNKEKLHTHQKIGLVTALAAAIILTSITSR